MNFIIQTDDNTYFGGWDPITGHLRFTRNKSFAYRMRGTMAEQTLGKCLGDYPGARILNIR